MRVELAPGSAGEWKNNTGSLRESLRVSDGEYVVTIRGREPKTARRLTQTILNNVVSSPLLNALPRRPSKKATWKHMELLRA